MLSCHFCQLALFAGQFGDALRDGCAEWLVRLSRGIECERLLHHALLPLDHRAELSLKAANQLQRQIIVDLLATKLLRPCTW